MFKKKTLTVGQYIEYKGTTFKDKKVRVLGSHSRHWFRNMDREIESVKITEKFVFIKVKER